MAEFTRYEIFMLLNQQGPLWLVGVDLSRADLRGARLNGATLWHANLKGANLQWAVLHGTDLRQAWLSDAVLDGALYNNETKWLQGFDQGRAGAKYSNARS